MDVTGLVALDSGLSTGGFTDCLLQRGAIRVYGVDVGFGQVNAPTRNTTFYGCQSSEQGCNQSLVYHSDTYIVAAVSDKGKSSSVGLLSHADIYSTGNTVKLPLALLSKIKTAPNYEAASCGL